MKGDQVHHRCTRCKEESYPRHKRNGGVFCEHCIRDLSYRGPRFSLRGLWGRFTGFIAYVYRRFTGKQTPRSIQRQKDKADYTRLKDMEVRARRTIPHNPSQMVPQKRGG